jgi:glycosyltransferase involved in cell wall biosynthesis
MNVLMISGDKNILVEGSSAHTRLLLQRAQVDRLDVFVWPHVHSLRQIREAAAHGQYDVITAQDPFWRGHLAWHLSRTYHTKLNLQVHTDLLAEPWWRRQWAYVQLRRATSIRVVSERAKLYLAHLFPEKKMTVLPIYIDILRFSSVIRRPHAGKNILWIGRFEDEKNPLEAMCVLREVLREVPDARLTMIGEGSWRQRLLDAAANLPVTISLTWQDPLLYLDTADVLLSTSKYESWGAVFIEALAAGVPVVAPDVGIAREAGATVVPRPWLAAAVAQVLRSGTRGVLQITLPTAAEWAHAWRGTLI